MHPKHDSPIAASTTQALDDYLAAAEAGTAPPRAEFLARYPELADDLDACLAALDFIGRAAEGPRAVAAELAEAPPPEQVTGQLGDFRLIREVGCGGMGVVYEAEQISLGRRVALKVLPFAATMDQRQIQRFHNEARAAALLDHPHIVHVHAVGCERAVHFYAMQFIEGQTLAAMIADLRQPAGRAASAVEPTTTHVAGPPAADTAARASASTERAPRDRAYFRRVAELGIQAAEALDHAHTLGIVHRDVKPANLLIDGRGGLWVTDFGLAHMQSDARLTMTGDLVGTLRYMSPEQALAKRVVVDHRTDVYSLGATLYELLTLEPAYSGNDRQELLRQIAFEEPRSPRRINRAIPAELETIVQKAMEKNPADRYATAKDLANDLRRFLEDRPIQARRPSMRQRTAKWARRHRPAVIAATIAAFVVTAVVGGAAGFWYQYEQDRMAREQDNLQVRQEHLTADAARQLDEAGNQLKEIDATLADPVKVSQLLSNIDGWRDGLARARAAWRHAKDLADSNADVVSEELTERLRQMEHELQAAEADWTVAKALDDSRLGAANLVNGVWNPGTGVRRFQMTLQQLGIDLQDAHQAKNAQRVRSHRLRYVVVAGLDYWAMFTSDSQKVPIYLNLARAADPDSWRDRVRQQDDWLNPELLKKLVGEADLSRQSPQAIHLLASRLKGAKLDAVDFLRTGLLHHPHDFWLHLEVGEATENWENRIGHYYAALSVRPQSSPVHNNLAHCLERRGDYSAALRHFRKSLECDPLHIASHIGLARTLLALKDVRAADKCLQTCADLADRYASSPGWREHHAQIHKALADALFHAGKMAEAEAAYRKAIKLQPNDPNSHFWLAEALGKQKKVAEAEAAYRMTIALKPDDFFAHNNLGAMLSRRGKKAEAEAAFHQAIAVNPDYYLAYANLGDVLKARGKLAEAEAAHRKAIACATALAGTVDAVEVAATEAEKVALRREARTEARVWLRAKVERLLKQARARVTETPTVLGTLTEPHCEQLHELKLEADKMYVIDMQSKQLDSYLKLYDPAGKLVAENDDVAPNTLDARIVLTPTAGGVYRIIATSFERRGRGAYTLTIRAVGK